MRFLRPGRPDRGIDYMPRRESVDLPRDFCQDPSCESSVRNIYNIVEERSYSFTAYYTEIIRPV